VTEGEPVELGSGMESMGKEQDGKEVAHWSMVHRR
jgi:hypothetical protein